MGSGQLGGLNDLFPGSAGLAVFDVFVDAAGEQIHILLHHADLAAQGMQGHVPNVLAVDFDAAAGYVVKPGNQAAQGGLAAAGGAHQRHGISGVDVQVDVRQHVAQGLGIGKLHVFEIDIALYAGQRHRAGAILNVAFHVHDFVEALNGGDAPLEGLGKFHDPADGGQKGGDVQQNRHQFRGFQLAVNHENRADDDHDDVHHAVKQTGYGMEPGHGVVHGLFDVQKTQVALGEFLFFNFLVGEGFDHSYAGKAVLHLGVQFAQLMALGLEAGPHALGENVGTEHHHRHYREDNQRQQRVHLRHNNERNDDLDQRDEHFLREMVGKFGDLVQVRGDSGHDLADFCGIIIRMGKILQMAEQIPAHVRFDVGAHNVADGLHVIIGGGVDDAQHHVKRTHQQHVFYRQLHGGVHARGGNALHDFRQHQIADGGKGGAEQIQHHDLPIRLEIGRKAPGQPYALAQTPLFLFHWYLLRKVFPFASIYIIRRLTIFVK